MGYGLNAVNRELENRARRPGCLDAGRVRR